MAYSNPTDMLRVNQQSHCRLTQYDTLFTMFVALALIESIQRVPM